MVNYAMDISIPDAIPNINKIFQVSRFFVKELRKLKAFVDTKIAVAAAQPIVKAVLEKIQTAVTKIITIVQMVIAFPFIVYFFFFEFEMLEFLLLPEMGIE